MERPAVVRAITAAFVVACAAAFVACRRSGPDWRILQLYSGQTSVGLLQSPAKVQAFRVATGGAAPKPGELHAGPFVASGAPVEVPADAAAELGRILTDADTYDWQRSPKREAFRPQAALWFVRGSYVLEIALDLSTAQLAVYAGEQPLGFQSFDAARPRLLAIAKRLFPDDPAIGALK